MFQHINDSLIYALLAVRPNVKLDLMYLSIVTVFLVSINYVSTVTEKTQLFKTIPI